MAKGSFIDITQTNKDRNNWRMVTEELEDRFKAMHRMVSYAAAKEAFDQVLAGIPSGAAYKDLRKALKISEIGGMKKGSQGGFSVHAPVKGRRVKKLDIGKTLVFVTAKKRLVRPDPAIKLLEDTSPWTADTIPFWPNKKEAVVVQRKTSKKEVDQVAKSKKNELAGIRAQLREMGRKIKKKKVGDPGHPGRKGKAIPDVGMQALELEFGGQGKRAKPVWRKAIRALRGSAMKRMPFKHKVIMEAATKPNSKRWKRWPAKMDKVGAGEARKYSGFQKRLG
jgi:hypothetical protein